MNIDKKTFREFCNGQKNLVDTLNHRMTKVEINMGIIKNEVIWIKRILWAIFSVATTSFIAITIKTLFGT